MKQFFLLTSLLILLFSCKTENKTELEAIPVEQKNLTNKTEDKSFDESEFEPLDISKFHSSKLLIGKQNKLSKNRISELNILGYDSYKLNSQGLITKTVNMTNNYGEYFYNKNGKPYKVLYKQHSPKLTYFERVYNYSNKGELKEIIETKLNKNSEIEKRKVISKPEELEKIKEPFKRALEFEPYKIDTTKRLILTYRNDLLFCCGEKMDGKNRLLYYYGQNGLIDSLIIQKMDLSKRMKFTYEYK